jgi:hypothetical protein
MRMIVPDTSVMVPAFFPERLLVGGNEFDVSARARPIAAAILTREVEAFAPDVLLAAFVNTAAAKAFDARSIRRMSATRFWVSELADSVSACLANLDRCFGSHYERKGFTA